MFLLGVHSCYMRVDNFFPILWSLMYKRHLPSPGFYERLVAELEEIADHIERRPELNHRAAARLRQVAKDIRHDLKVAGSERA